MTNILIREGQDYPIRLQLIDSLIAMLDENDTEVLAKLQEQRAQVVALMQASGEAEGQSWEPIEVGPNDVVVRLETLRVNMKGEALTE